MSGGSKISLLKNSLGMRLVVLSYSQNISSDQRSENLHGGYKLDRSARKQARVDRIPVADELPQIMDGLAAREEEGGDLNPRAADEANSGRGEGRRLVWKGQRATRSAQAATASPTRKHSQVRNRSDIGMIVDEELIDGLEREPGVLLGHKRRRKNVRAPAGILLSASLPACFPLHGPRGISLNVTLLSASRGTRRRQKNVHLTPLSDLYRRVPRERSPVIFQSSPLPSSNFHPLHTSHPKTQIQHHALRLQLIL